MKMRTLEVTCRCCKKVYELNVTEEQIIRYREGAFAQHAFSHLSPNERELLISGICGKCFDEMFS
ncbi:hypothetical protein [Weizmannia phage Youna2]